ncbi:MAG: alpha/beta hydrolase [Acidiferrobacterales bacterium]
MSEVAPQPCPGSRRETVILVNGLWMPGWVLAPLARRLRCCGFEVHGFTYRSVAHGLRENADLLQKFVDSLPGEIIHFVGYSLGGIVVRALFHFHPQRRPGRIVTLGSPHQGSHAAATIAAYPWGRRILRRSLPALVSVEGRNWPLPLRDIGIIAGTLNVGLGRCLPRQLNPSDGTVGVAEAQLPGATKMILMKVSHFGLLVSPGVADAVCRFFRTGQFDSRDPAPRRPVR